MKTSRTVIAVLILASSLFFSLTLSGDAWGGTLFGKSQTAPTPVKAELFTDSSAIASSRPFRIGVLFRMDPEWHIYWKNPGDAGLPTDFAVRLPEGFKVGPLQWPVPQRFGQPGGLVGYGYAESVMLIAEVTPPAGLTPGEDIPIFVDASWLGCRDICLIGKAELSAKVVAAAKPVAANDMLFAEWKTRIPQTTAVMMEKGILTGLDTATLRTAEGSNVIFNIMLSWANPPEKVEFFPAPTEGLLIVDPVINTVKDRSRIRFTARQEGEKIGGSVEVVVGFSLPDGKRGGFTMPVDMPAGNAPKE